jgi:hypothetical protein
MVYYKQYMVCCNSILYGVLQTVHGMSQTVYGLLQKVHVILQTVYGDLKTVYGVLQTTYCMVCCKQFIMYYKKVFVVLQTV